MKKLTALIATAAVSVGFSPAASAASGDLKNLTPLVGDYVASNPGFETAIPNDTNIDNNHDGILEGYALSFDVYKTGTNTKLFSTPPVSVTVCASGMSGNGSGSGGSPYHTTTVKRIGNTLTGFYSFSTGCLDSTESSPSSAFWGFNLSTAGKQPWVKPITFLPMSISGLYGSDGFDGYGITSDMNNNGIGEWLVTGGAILHDPKSRTMAILDGETGSTLSSQTYTEPSAIFEAEFLPYVVGVSNVGALVGDYVASNAGQETVVVAGTVTSSYECTYRFDVYKAGTHTKLFSTPDSPQGPCGINTVKRMGNTLVLSRIYTNFSTGPSTKPHADFYGVNLSAAGKQPWINLIPDPIEGMGVLPDMNKNGTGEMLLTTIVGSGSSSSNPPFARVVSIYDGETGKILSSKTYPNISDMLTGFFSDGSNDALRNISPLVGDYVASNAGFETIIPNSRTIDRNKDGIAEGYLLRFDVYKTGTVAKLFSTPEKSFTVCPSSLRDPLLNHSLKRIGNTLAIVTAVAREGVPTCSDSTYTPPSGSIYAVNLSAAGKQPWTKSINHEFLGIGILPDMNKNGVGELLVVPTDDSSTSHDFYVYIFDGDTGATLSSKVYSTPLN